ncbi:hypothetical protein Axy09_046 [Achromobacter phage vB_AxyP_19-32_Axy09]|uniref:Uncharacterized protein n=2 Tax=Axyvirus TaxID=3424993 RepID=A0A514CW73_9CAUD|nr:hypothetical protein Axy09_046 [Achromobacter phage vB_AxyP_19-32_Axy09]QDH84705.1 hypothetical protein Axy23_047 [Achromobacter phage vB_AxyP_19-32_Axy23]
MPRIIAHPYDVKVFLHLDRDKMARAVFRNQEGRDEFADLVDGTAGICCPRGPDIHIGVFVQGAVYRRQTLVHELVHASMEILGAAGVPVERSSNEALAYLMDDLYARLERFL